MGDYKIKANTLLTSGSPVPTFGENCIRIRHKEYLGDVFGTTAFSNSSYSINPGVSTTFPWLSTVAANYQEFAFAGLVFSFVSTSADALNSTNTALGKIIMATDYNSVDSSFTTPQQMLATEFCNYGKPASDLLHAVECDPKLRPLLWQYVRTGGVPTGKDARFYDLGNFQIASQGMQASANIGGLWVAYDIILCKPVVATAGAPYDAFYSPNATSTSTQFSTTTNASTRPIGGIVTNTQYSFPPNLTSGTYRMIVFGTTTPSGTCQAPLAGSSNVGTVVGLWGDGAAPHQTTTGSCTSYFYSIDLAITSANATLTLQNVWIQAHTLQMFIMYLGA